MRVSFWRRPPADLPPAPRRWTWLLGHRMLANSPYVMPKGQAEGDRLEIQHYLLKLAAGGLYRAPLRQVYNILDVACGTGTWGREMALAFPQARVLGFDLDASLPERAMQILGPSGQFPQNFRFQVADALQPFLFDDGAFDFVHARLISPFVPIARWPDVVSEMVRVLRPAGIIELVELEALPQTPSPAFMRLTNVARAFMEGRGLYTGVGDALPGYLRQAGIQQVQQHKFVLGQGGTQSETARQQRLLATDMLAAQANFKPVALKLGMPEAEFDALHEQAKREVPQMGIYLPVVFCFGMKL